MESDPLPPFRVRRIRAEDQDGIIRMKRTEYDDLLRKQPQAALRYIDESDGEVILVGSSFELGQRLQDPVEMAPTRRSAGKNTATGPISRPMHTFDVEKTADVVDTWSKLDEKTAAEGRKAQEIFHSQITNSAKSTKKTLNDVQFGQASPPRGPSLNSGVNGEDRKHANRWASYSNLPGSFTHDPVPISTTDKIHEKHDGPNATDANDTNEAGTKSADSSSRRSAFDVMAEAASHVRSSTVQVPTSPKQQKEYQPLLEMFMTELSKGQKPNENQESVVNRNPQPLYKLFESQLTKLGRPQREAVSTEARHDVHSKASGDTKIHQSQQASMASVSSQPESGKDSQEASNASEPKSQQNVPVAPPPNEKQNPTPGELLTHSIQSLLGGLSQLASTFKQTNSELQQQIAVAQREFPNNIEKALSASLAAIDTLYLAVAPSKLATPSTRDQTQHFSEFLGNAESKINHAVDTHGLQCYAPTCDRASACYSSSHRSENEGVSNSSEAAFTQATKEATAVADDNTGQSFTKVFRCRHTLQKMFLATEHNTTPPNFELAHKLVQDLESLKDVSANIILSTKIHKVLKHILRLKDFPEGHRYNFLTRCSELANHYQTKIDQYRAKHEPGDVEDRESGDSPYLFEDSFKNVHPEKNESVSMFSKSTSTDGNVQGTEKRNASTQSDDTSLADVKSTSQTVISDEASAHHARVETAIEKMREDLLQDGWRPFSSSSNESSSSSRGFVYTRADILEACIEKLKQCRRKCQNPEGEPHPMALPAADSSPSSHPTSRPAVAHANGASSGKAKMASSSLPNSRFWRVHKVIGRRYITYGDVIGPCVKQYLVRWGGSDASQDVWYDADNLQDCQTLIDDFESNVLDAADMFDPVVASEIHRRTAGDRMVTSKKPIYPHKTSAVIIPGQNKPTGSSSDHSKNQQNNTPKMATLQDTVPSASFYGQGPPPESSPLAHLDDYMTIGDDHPKTHASSSNRSNHIAAVSHRGNPNINQRQAEPGFPTGYDFVNHDNFGPRGNDSSNTTLPQITNASRSNTRELRHRQSWHPSSQRQSADDWSVFQFSPSRVMAKYPPLSHIENPVFSRAAEKDNASTTSRAEVKPAPVESGVTSNETLWKSYAQSLPFPFSKVEKGFRPLAASKSVSALSNDFSRGAKKTTQLDSSAFNATPSSSRNSIHGFPSSSSSKYPRDFSLQSAANISSRSMSTTAAPSNTTGNAEKKPKLQDQRGLKPQRNARVRFAEDEKRTGYEVSTCRDTLIEMGFESGRAEAVAEASMGNLDMAIDALEEDQKARTDMETVERMIRDPMPGTWDDELYG